MRVASSFVVLLIIAGCASPTAPSPVFELTTDRVEYLYDNVSGPIVYVTVRNISRQDAGVAKCGGVVLTTPEALLGDKWKVFVNYACHAPFESIPLAPGETTVVRGSVPGVGRLRFRVGVFISPTEHRLDASVSNEFTVR